MRIFTIKDKNRLETFFRQNTDLHIYSLGDMDDFFWPHSQFFGLENDDGSLAEVATYYTALKVPTLLVQATQLKNMLTLLEQIKHELPSEFYAHLTPGLEDVFKNTHHCQRLCTFHRMSLHDKKILLDKDISETIILSRDDLDEIYELYKSGYPDHWFDPLTLETKKCYGLRLDSKLVAIAGVHVYSEQYRVAALGNVTTHPNYRNQGLGHKTSAALCESLLQTVDHIGLNVKDENKAAIALYEKLGFEITHTCEEYLVKRI